MTGQNWSFKPEDWQFINSIFQERTFKNVPLKKTFGVALPNTSGVYVICLSPFSSGVGFLPKLYNAVYVGQAENIQARFSDHVDGKTNVKEVVQNFTKTEFWYVECTSAELNEIEKKLYDILGPAKNQISPPFKGSLRAPVAAN